MLTWMLYVIAVSLVLGLAALAAEQAARFSHASTRWYWLAAILASLVVPSVIASVSIEVPDIAGRHAVEKILVLRHATSIPLPPASWLASPAAVAGHAAAGPRTWDPWLRDAWLIVSLLMLSVLALQGAQLHRRRQTWRRMQMAGRDVLMTEDVGPAVVGFLRPRIAVPQWLTGSDRLRQSAVIAHEQSHLSAGDPQLFTVALCLLVFMPWNLPLWWQLKRLRNAIEVDCDARVLASGQDAVAYGETLIAVGERQSAFVGAVAAMSESRSFLERRIAIMLASRKRWWRAPAAALGCLSLALVALAAQVSPPNAQGSGPGATADAPQEIQLDATTLDLYAGYYKVSDQLIMTVTRKDNQLSAQVTGQPDVPIYPASSTHFFYKLIKADIDFTATGGMPATGLVLHQNGQNLSMPRIDAATAQQIQDALTARTESNSPAPGSEALLRTLLTRHGSGVPRDDELMTPQFAAAVKSQEKTVAQWLISLGALQSIQFQGVGAQGNDTYLVKFEKGSIMARIVVANGKIAGLNLQPL